MDFSLEDVKAAIVAVVEPITQRLSAIEQKVGMGGEQKPAEGQPSGQQQKPQEGTKPMSKDLNKDVDDALDALRHEERARYNAELANVKRKAKIDLYTMTLSAKTGTPEALVRKKLNSFQSEEAMDLYVKNTQDKKDEDVKLGIEREHGDSPDLRDEWEGYKTRYNSNIDFDTYKSLAERMTKPKDYRGKQVYAVRDNGGAFA